MNLWLRLFLPFAAGYCFSYFLRNTNAVIAQDLSRDLSLGAAQLGLLTSAYLASFSLAQLPLGVLLDRFGPRRVEASLLLIAAAGCFLFALADQLLVLMSARALIGLGMSACLMASFATFARAFAPERQASLNAAVMVAGSLGALVASTPLVMLNASIGWRGTFVLMGVIALAVSGVIASTPERASAPTGASFAAQMRALRAIFTSRVFWCFAPQGITLVGGFTALQSLWAVPFLMATSGQTQRQAADAMGLMALGMLLGFLALALSAQRLQARGVALERVLGSGCAASVAALALICGGIELGGSVWLVLGACFGTSNLSYALLQRHFDLSLAGRVNTALNLMVFCGAFVVQWLYGVALDALAPAYMSLANAHRLCVGALLLVQCVSVLWFWRNVPRLHRPELATAGFSGSIRHCE
jgi:predicted MFS family arabinose efflux permease